jgi:hypothetical protein
MPESNGHLMIGCSQIDSANLHNSLVSIDAVFVIFLSSLSVPRLIFFSAHIELAIISACRSRIGVCIGKRGWGKLTFWTTSLAVQER